MKANYYKLNSPIEQAFHIRKDVRDYFEDKWHFHEMLELVYIEKGAGGRYIGDSIDSFSSGEVVLLGSKLPHVWKSNFLENGNLNKKKCVAYVLQFPTNFLGEQFLNLAESKQIKELFSRAERGIVFREDARKVMAKKIKALSKHTGMHRLLKFIDLLHFAANTNNYRLLASPRFVDTLFDSDKKTNKVFAYVMDNFTEHLELKTVAEIAGMNKTAFCRYFKKRTKKTFSTFLNEVRIGHACKFIREDEIPITEAAYLSGYNSPSYFYKQFKLIKGVSPTSYQSRVL